MNKKATERAEAIELLREALKPGDRIACRVLHVSRSGMSRSIELEIAAKDDEGRMYVRDISWLVARAIGERFDNKRGGVVMTGCGMDMTFAAVYNLGRVLFPSGFGISGTNAKGRKVTPKTAKQAARMVAAGVKFRGRNGDLCGWDRDGGYALDHRG